MVPKKRGKNVTCHMSLVTNNNNYSHRPCTSNSLQIHSRLIRIRAKTSDTLFDFRMKVFCHGTHIQTDGHGDSMTNSVKRTQRAELVKMNIIPIKFKRQLKKG